MDDDLTNPKKSTNKLAVERTDLAFERSIMASDRTTMSFMRTSIALIGFGFSIPTLFSVITGVPGLEDTPIERARFIGLFMLALAVFMLLTTIVQQVLYLRRLTRLSGTNFPFSIALFSSCVLLGVAVFATLNILSKVQPL